MAINIEGAALRVLTLDTTNFETVTLDSVVFARKPTITTQPVGGTINDDQSHTMSVVADGLGTSLTYQWFMDGGAISGATGTSHTFTPAGDTTNRTFFCQVAGFGGGNTQTSTVTVTVNPSWAANTTIVKAYIDFGLLQQWGYNSNVAPTLGSLTPNVVDGVTYLAIFSSEIAGMHSNELFVNANTPVGSTVRLETSQGTGWTGEGSQGVYQFPSGIQSWLRTQGSHAIRLQYFASLDADYYDESKETIDEYHIRWGVHKGQRPDLYK